MAKYAELNENTPIYVHISDINSNSFQWFTHKKTFQITKCDTFDDFITKILNKISKKYAIQQAHIITCLKQRNKIAIFIELKEDDQSKIDIFIEQMSKTQSKFFMNDNIYESITCSPAAVNLENICIWLIAQHEIITIQSSSKPVNANHNRITMNTIHKKQYSKTKSKSIDKKQKKKVMKHEKQLTFPINNNKSKTIPKKVRKHRNDRMELCNNNRIANITTCTKNKTKRRISNHKNNNNSHKSRKNRVSNSNNNNNTNNRIKQSNKRMQLSDMTSKTKQSKNISNVSNIRRPNKRSRPVFDSLHNNNHSKNKNNNHNKNKNKKRKISSDGECIWLLIDMATTMDTELLFNSGQTKHECVRDMIQIMVTDNWRKQECVNNHYRLHAFSNELKHITPYVYMRYNPDSPQELLNQFDECKQNEIAEYEQCISFKNAIDLLLNEIIFEKKSNGKNVLNRNRIILFTDAERGNINTNIDNNTLKHKMIRWNITMDAIHVTKSQRSDIFLTDVCACDGIGKYFNPAMKNKTIQDYTAIVKSEIMNVLSLRNASKKDSVIELD